MTKESSTQRTFHVPKCGLRVLLSFLLFFLPTKCQAFTSLLQNKAQINKARHINTSESKKSTGSELYSSTTGLPAPFFASVAPPPQEGKASITTRVPLGTLFVSRDYTFATVTNVRGYEWTLKEVDELLDDFIDASRGYLQYDSSSKQDYELSQIVLVPMEWDKEKYGLGNRYDVFDGQQRLVSLSLIFASLRDAFQKDEDMVDTAAELANMLSPSKVRKADILRIELHKRDNTILSHILKNEMSELDAIKDVKSLTRANQRIYENYKRLSSRVGEMNTEDRVKLLDYMTESVHLLVCIPETATIARNLVTAQGKGMDNEPVDDFKGLVCFRYTQNEENMYKTFDGWDRLASTLDLDNDSVGRQIVNDACLLRTTATLRTKISKRNTLLSLELWLRDDVLSNRHEGNIFFKKKVEPASLTLGQYRNGYFHLLGCYSRSKDTDIWNSITMRLNFLRLMTTTVSSTKDAEMVILELLLRACGTLGEKGTPLAQLDKQLHGVEILVLWMALSKPTARERYEKCFEFLDVIESVRLNINLISQEEKSEIREALVVNEFGSTASGKRVAIAILKRINCYVNELKGSDKNLIDLKTDYHLEHILPLTATKKAWGESWPDKDERSKWVNRLGNFAIVSNKPTALEAKKPFDVKKERFAEEAWPLTNELAEMNAWNSNNLIKNLANIVNLIDKVWSL